MKKIKKTAADKVFDMVDKLDSRLNKEVELKYKSDLDFADLNRSTKRDFWFASKEFADSL
jgi:hypothetical protein